MEKNLMEITETEIKSFESKAIDKLKSITYMPKFYLSTDTEEKTEDPLKFIRSRSVVGNPISSSKQKSTFSIYKEFLNINKEDELFTDTENHLLRMLRRGISIFYVAEKNYRKSSGLDQLIEKSKINGLDETGKTDLREKSNSSSLVSLFVFLNYLNYSLSDYMNDNNVDISTPKPVELNIDNSIDCLNGSLYELIEFIKDHAKDDVTLTTVFKNYVSGMIEYILIKKESLRHLEYFTNFIYKIDKDNFEINGFEIKGRLKEPELIMAFKKPEEVIGNHIAKYQAQRIAKMLMCYDFDRQKNPFVELGGFIFSYLGDGKPGTGKTTLIQMKGGLLNDYCKAANYPFRYRNFDISQIDSYQGKSGQNAKKFIEEVLDPNYISFGTIDDIDQIAGKRGDQQSSAGQQEVTAILMGALAGSGTIVRGNTTFGAFTNYAENLDDALRQRFGLRYLIDGPQTMEDYIDIMGLLLGKNHNIPTGKHDLYSTQNIKSMINKSFEKYNKPSQTELLKVFNNMGNISTLTDIGEYLHQISNMDERFTGRAIKNITDAVKTRAMDFELPDQWFENPELFLWEPYDYKLEKIKELMEPISIDMVIQETNRYVESELRYTDNSANEDIDKIVKQLENRQKAEEIFKSKFK